MPLLSAARACHGHAAQEVRRQYFALPQPVKVYKELSQPV
jgi:hypothetical protein